MDTASIIDRLNNDPEFAQLPYDQQVEVRAKIFSQKLAQDPDFRALPDKAKDLVWQKVLYQKPVYQDKQYAAQMDALEQGIQNGDKASINKAIEDTAFLKAEDNFALTKFIDGIVNKAAQKIEPIYSKIDPQHSIHVAPLSDQRKAAEYFDRLLNVKRATTERASLTLKLFPAEKLGANLVAGAVGLGPFYTGLVGTLEAPAGLAKLGMSAVDAASQNLIKRGFGMALYKGSRALVHAAAGGVVGVINEGLKKIMENNASNPNWVDVVNTAKKSFGMYFLGDLAMFAVGGLLKAGASGARKVFSKGFVKEASKTTEEYSKAVADALTGKIDPVLFNRLTPKQQAILTKVQKFNGVLKNVEKQTPDNILEMVGFQNGLDVTIKDGKYAIGKIGDEATKHASSFAEAAQIVHDLINKEPVVKLNALDEKVLGSGAKDLKFNAKFNSVLPDEALSNASVLTKLATSYKGKYSSSKVKLFGYALMKNLGFSDDAIKSLKVDARGDAIKVFVNDEQIGTMPKIVATHKQELSAVQDLIKGFKEKAPKEMQTKPILTSTQMLKEQVRSKDYSFGFINNIAEKKLGGTLRQEGKEFILQTPQETRHFLDFHSAADYVLSKGMDEKLLKLHLKYNEGLSLIRDKKTNKLKLKDKSRNLGVFNNVEEIVQEYPDLMPKVNPDLGPKLALVDNNRIRVTYNKDVVVGNYQDLLKELNHFADYEKKANVMRFGTGKDSVIEVNPTSKSIELEIPEIAYRKKFGSIKEAKAFIKEGWAERENLDGILADKGYRLEVAGGKYFVYGEKNVAFEASTKEELMSILKEAPIPEWATEYSGISTDILDTMEKPPEGMFKPVEFKVKRQTMSPLTTVSHTYRPPDAWFVKAIEQGGDKNILEAFRKLDTTMQFLTASEGKVAKELVGIWKGYKRKARVKIGGLLETPEAMWNEVIAKNKLKPQDVAVAKAMRKFFDSAAVRFQLSYDKYLKDYLPRMRKTYLKDPGKYRNDADMAGFIEDSFGGRVPKDLDAFFKHQRVSDVVRFIREDDPLTMALKYNAIGQRETFLGPLWREIDDYIKANKKNIDPVLLMRFNAYRSDLMGIPSGIGEKALLEFSKRFYKGIKGANIPAGLAGDLTKAMMSWGYLSAMGFRVWLPIRNMFQVWTTLAPRIGNSWVSDAIRVVAKDKEGKIFQMLRNRGVISENLPLYGSTIIEGEQALSRLLHKGLKWYKNSDEWTRAVAYTASQLRFRDAVKRFSKGLLKENNFMELSGLNMIPVDLRNEALSFIRAGKWSNAEDTFARTITTDTMFSYRAGMAPTSFRGAVGKLFGMMGHYPVYYLENVKRALKYSTTGQKIAYAGRFLGNSLALYYAFHDVLGINATNFLPWSPAMFSGGPYYQLMNEALLSFGKGYQSREARAKLFGIKHKNGKLIFDPTKAEVTKWGIPMGFMTNNIIKGLRYFDDGNAWAGFLALTTAPINPDMLK